jgi:hypothetical protein
MYKRVIAQGYTTIRFPREVARYHMMQHDADRYNPYNIRSNAAFRLRPKHYVNDGVNSLVYHRVATEFRPSYVWISVSLPEPPANFRSYPRDTAKSCSFVITYCPFVLFMSDIIVYLELILFRSHFN